MHTNKLNEILYFPYSPVIILSSTAMDEYMKDVEVTRVLTKSKYPIFTWYFGK